MLTICHKCKSKTDRVIPQFKLDDGTTIFYCGGCRLSWELRGGKA